MKDLIKAQLYQLKKNRLVIIVFFAALLIQFTNIISEISYNEAGFPASTYIVDMGLEMIFMSIFFPIIFAGCVCGGDFPDKTTNYELMSGHTRKQVYFSRAVISLVGGAVGEFIIIIAPVVFLSVTNGWGTDILVREAVTRYLLMLFPIARIICEFIFFTYIVKNPYITMASSYLVMMLGVSYGELFSDKASVFLGISNIMKLGTYESWSTYTIDNTVDMIKVYDAALSVGDIISTVSASVIIGGLFLLIGYRYFHADDLN
ncbi:MAG: hypothetical protein NC225_08200 [Clostridium sp.]|nr:hypothetical protein [Clostridium sp.]MCM1399444.1 hypothetical protein [Clostridium sp.]MCM1459998.1 hypothetical protein [Bacteroides sp.]